MYMYVCTPEPLQAHQACTPERGDWGYRLQVQRKPSHTEETWVSKTKSVGDKVKINTEKMSNVWVILGCWKHLWQMSGNKMNW